MVGRTCLDKATSTMPLLTQFAFKFGRSFRPPWENKGVCWPICNSKVTSQCWTWCQVSLTVLKCSNWYMTILGRNFSPNTQVLKNMYNTRKLVKKEFLNRNQKIPSTIHNEWKWKIHKVCIWAQEVIFKFQKLLRFKCNTAYVFEFC